MSRKPIYQLEDMKGRILIPKELRDQGRINYGDIVRLGLSGSRRSVPGSCGGICPLGNSEYAGKDTA